MQSRDRYLTLRGGVASATGLSVIVTCLAFSATAGAQVKAKAKPKAEGAAAILEKMSKAATGTAKDCCTASAGNPDRGKG